MPGTALWVDAFVCLPGFTCLPLSPFICLPLSPSLDDPVWVDGFICLPLSFVSRCLPAWMPGTALWVDGFICLPLSPFICLPAWMPGAARVHLSPFVSLHLSPVVSQPGCLGGQIHLSPFVSLHLSPVVSQPGSGTALWVDGFMCLPLSPSFVSRSLPAWMPGTPLWVDGFICLPLSPLISPVVSQPGCLARLSGWTGSFVSLCLPSFVSRCLPAWMPGFVCLCLPGCLAPLCFPLSPFICLPLSPSLDAWHGSLGGRIHLSPVVSQPPFVSLHLSPVVSQPGCRARLSGWTGSFVTLCLPSFVSRCLPTWMPGTALWVDGFICLPLSPFICLARLSGLCFPSFVSRCLPAWMSGTALQADRFTCLPLSPFICPPLSPSLDAWHGSLGGQFHLSPFVSLHLAPLVSQPGCLSRLSRRTDSLVSLGSPSFVSHLCGWTD